MIANRPSSWLGAVLLGALAAPDAWSHPGTGIVVDGAGQVYFVHGVRDRILKLDAAGTLSTFVENAEGRPLVNPHHLVLDHAGRLHSLGDNGGQILLITPAGDVTRWGPAPDVHRLGFVGAGGDPFTVDSMGNIVAVRARAAHPSQVVRIGADGALSILAGGEGGHADGKTGAARFQNLHSAGFAWEPGDGLLLTDNGTCVRRITPEGTVTTVAGGTAEGFADGPADQARFHDASGLTVDSNGRILVADGGNHRIRAIAPDGTVSTVAGSGRRGGNDGPSPEASFEQPSGVAIGPDGTIYVLEIVVDHPRVRRIGQDGKVTTLATLR